MIRKDNLNLDPQAQAGIKRLCEDFVFWCESCCKIRDELGNVSPLKLKPVQLRFVEFCLKQWQEEGHIRVVIVKGRQMGLSTIVSAFIFHKLMQHGGKKGLVLAQSEATAKAIFGMYQRIYEGLGENEYLQPKIKYNSQSELVFKELDTSIMKATAGGLDLRGHTFQYAHLTEVAFWPASKAADMMLALRQGIPEGNETIMVLESTSNGCQGPYWEYYKKAAAKEIGFRVFFSAWFEDAKYALAAPDDWELSEFEKDYQTEYQLNRNQMYWRHRKIAESGPDKFEQEYPSNPDEAFKSTGGQVFDPENLDEMASDRKPLLGKFRVNIEEKQIEECGYGELLVYKKKLKGEVYTCGVDTAMGLEAKDRDYSCAQILDGSGEQAAIWRGKVEPHVFGEIMDFLGREYNNARMVVESNKDGASVLWVLNRANYPNLYTRVHEKRVSERLSDELGFATTQNTKSRLINALRAAIREREIQVHDETTYSELRHYVADERGKMGAARGHHDDTVMALALAVHDLDRSYAPIDVEPFRVEDVYAYGPLSDAQPEQPRVPERYRQKIDDKYRKAFARKA